MKNNIKEWIVFKRVLFFLFLLFLINYFSVQSGYYEKKVYDKMILTEEQKQAFEEDVSNGLDVDLTDYLEDDYVDTSNTASRLGQKIGDELDDFINHKVIKVMEAIGSLFHS